MTSMVCINPFKNRNSFLNLLMHLKLYLNQKLLHRPSLESMCLNACTDLNNVIELYVFNDLKVKVNI